MKALTLWQPWASLWAAGIKRNETRSWATSHRGPLVVHAAKADCDDLYRLLGRDVHAITQLDAATFRGLYRHINELPRGCIVGTVDVVGCYELEEVTFSDGSVGPAWRVAADGTETDWPSALELLLGNYTPGRFAWIGRKHRTVEPIPCHGRQSLWTVSSIEVACLAGEGVVVNG